MKENQKEATAKAGRRGADVRSDCWVCISLTDSGGIDLSLRSKVDALYGTSIRDFVADMMGAFGIEHARIELDDAGAYPFVLAARIEAAVRQLDMDIGEGYVSDLASGAEYESNRLRFRRSRLYLPGNEAKFMLNAGLHGPDGVILDLEDSVAPAVKAEARVLVRNALRSIDFEGAERMVRINQGPMGLEDLEFVIPHNVHVVLIPKVESVQQVHEVDGRIGEILKSRKIDRPVYLMPIVESALGAIRAYEIAMASENICALTIGLEDYTADIGAQRTREGTESFWARSQVVNAARAAGVQPIDTVFSDVSDMEGLRRSALEARSLGFEGKGCIHPRQIPVIHKAFAPSERELERAREIAAAYQDAEARGLGAVSLGSKMIDPPVVKRALRIVEMARLLGMEDA